MNQIPAPSGLIAAVRSLMVEARDAIGWNPEAGALLDAAAQRLDQPLRVALAGRVKAGKSTLINALVGDQLAATDATECTRIITSYRDGVGYQVRARVADGSETSLRFERGEGSLQIELPDDTPVEQLEVTWPSATLRQMTLIDTPGIASLSASVAANTLDFLRTDAEQAPGADAVVYLLRRMHASDVRMLEAFHDTDLAQPAPVTAIGVLSRADEIGACRLDAMETAAAVAETYRRDARMKRLVGTVVPVSGLLAVGAASLRESDAAAIGQLAAAPTAAVDQLLLSADRFVAVDGPHVFPDLVSAEVREALLSSLGLFGVRLGVDLVRRGLAPTGAALSEELRRRSGIDDLRGLLERRFSVRADVLKARTGLLAVEAILAMPGVDAPSLANKVEQLRASAHELAELRLLDQCRSGDGPFADAEQVAAERLLGFEGNSPQVRLALGEDANSDQIRSAAMAELARWLDRAENPLTPRATADAARVLVRTCEGLLTRQSSTGAAPSGR